MIKTSLFTTLLILCASYDCVFNIEDDTYDLSSLKMDEPPDYQIYGTDFYNYRVNVCEPVFQSCNGDFTGMATQWYPGSGCIAVIGRQNPQYGGVNLPKLSYINDDDPTEGVKLVYKNGDGCGIFTGDRETVINVRCDKSQKAKLDSAGEATTCSYEFNFRSKAGCVPGNQGSSPKPRKKGWSTGTWYLIYLGTALALYFGLGTYINMKRTGLGVSDSIPNKEFWLDLPGMVTDGIRFVREKFQSKEEAFQPIEQQGTYI